MLFNNINEIAEFCKKYHPGSCRIFNLTDQLYQYPQLEDIVVCHSGWIDHHAPPLTHLIHLVFTVSEYLSTNPANVALIHCRAGRSRTGTVIACLLLYCKLASCPKDAVLMFNLRRSEQPSLKLPSQLRLIEYFHQMLQNYSTLEEMSLSNMLVKPPIYNITQITISPVPQLGVSRSGFTPYIEIYDRSKLLNDSSEPVGKFQSDRKYLPENEDVVIQPSLGIHGDVLMVFYHTALTSLGEITRKQICFFKLQLHTAFIQDEVLTLTNEDLDDVASDAPLPSQLLLILHLKRI